MVRLGDPSDGISYEELALATRNRGMPLEALRYDITPSGMHYLLIHFDAPNLDIDAWRLRIGGLVGRPLELSLEEIRSRPAVTIPVTMECAGNGRARLVPRPMTQPWLLEAVSTCYWTGAPLVRLLDEAKVSSRAAELVFTGADRGIQGDVEQSYQRSLRVPEAQRPDVLLAYEMNGRPLEPQHGLPLRLVVPGWYGMTSVKWLTQIEAVDAPFTGYQQNTSYMYQEDEEDPGEPVNRIRVRSLMVPPGMPDFFSRRRTVDAGMVELFGRAWSGTGPVTRVQVGVNGEWVDARLAEPVGPWAWRSWSVTWDASPGEQTLRCRAEDAQGNIQPLQQPWNLQGMGNNMVQEVTVTVR